MQNVPPSPKEVKEVRYRAERQDRAGAASERLPETRARLQAAINRRDEAVAERAEARASLDVADENFRLAKDARDAATDEHRRAVETVQSTEADIFHRRTELDADAREIKNGGIELAGAAKT